MWFRFRKDYVEFAFSFQSIISKKRTQKTYLRINKIKKTHKKVFLKKTNTEKQTIPIEKIIFNLNTRIKKLKMGVKTPFQL